MARTHMSSWFLYLLFFLVPIQTSFHITTDFAKIAGIYLDYLLPTIYLTDFIIISIIFFSYREKKLKLGKHLLFFLIYCFCFSNCRFLFIYFGYSTIYAAKLDFGLMEVFGREDFLRFDSGHCLGLFFGNAFFTAICDFSAP